MPPATEPLRERLLVEALGLLESDGVEAVGIREVARRAGVSHGAPRRHFRTRELLLAALAADGFALLATAVEDAARGSGPADPVRRLVAAGVAYVDFARGHRSRFDLMFRHDLLAGSGAGLRRTSLPLLAELGRLLGDARGRPATGDDAAGLWAGLHGIAVLSANRSLDVLDPRPDERRLVEREVAVHLAA